MKKAIGTVIGSFIFILIILAFFTVFIFMFNQTFDLLSSQLKNFPEEAKKRLENLIFISSSYDKYLIKVFNIDSSFTSTGITFDLFKIFDDKFVSINSFDPIGPTKHYTEIEFIFENINYDIATITSLQISFVFRHGISITDQVIQSFYIFDWVSNNYILKESVTFNSPLIQNFQYRIIKIDPPLSQYISSDGKVKVKIKAESLSNLAFESNYDYISLKINTNSLQKKVISYVLNSSYSSSKISSVIIYNSTSYLQIDVNISIPSNEIKLIVFSTDITNGRIKLVTKEGNIFTSIISN